MSKVFVTSDTHFGHANNIRYTNRPFSHVSEMNAHMLGVDDTVLFLGDFAMGPGVDPSFVRTYLQMLNGNILILLGNHDMPSKWSIGLNAILAEQELDGQIDERCHDGTRFVLNHFPLADWNGRYHGAVHLHGHTHTQYAVDVRLEKESRFDVGVDMYGGPVELTGDLRYLKTPKGWNV